MFIYWGHIYFMQVICLKVSNHLCTVNKPWISFLYNHWLFAIILCTDCFHFSLVLFPCVIYNDFYYLYFHFFCKSKPYQITDSRLSMASSADWMGGCSKCHVRCRLFIKFRILNLFFVILCPFSLSNLFWWLLHESEGFHLIFHDHLSSVFAAVPLLSLQSTKLLASQIHD